MQKNHSERTFEKQAELAIIVRSYMDTRGITEFTYGDLNGGTAEYIIEGQPCKGGCVVVHDVLATAAKKQPGFKYNGYIFENGDQEWSLLNRNLPKHCPNHKFSLFKKDSLAGGNVFKSANKWQFDQYAAPVNVIDRTYAEGMFYFDPHGDISPSAIAQYATYRPNYMILCNTQRNTIVRSLWRKSNGGSVSQMVQQVDRHWLISPPVHQMGWSWLLGVPDAKTAKHLAENTNKRYAREFLFPLDSEVGQACYKLMSETGHNIRKYFSKDYRYKGTVATH